MGVSKNGLPNLGLGIDTGGTYTDAIILNMDTGGVLSKAKALTTRGDLSVGISTAINQLDHSFYSAIKLVSVSSTLATNSVVEGKGCRVGLIVIGHEARERVPVDELVQIPGGHNLLGEERESLDLEKARDFVLRVRNKVDAFAISGYLSVRNPEHEQQVKAMVEELTLYPVVCGHELSTKLGFHERTITAVLNARLIPVISDLISSLKKVMADLRIDAPLMIVKGDGSLMAEKVAKQRPVETILSGPAASLIGGKTLTEEKSAVVVDVGGTTTDIGILRDGRPRLDPEGATIGGWRTRVKAVDITTSGIGGDSRVVVAGGNILLSPLRVIPLCIAANDYPQLVKKLEAELTKTRRAPPHYMELETIPQTTEFFIFCRRVNGIEISPEQEKVIEVIKSEPRSVYEIGDLVGLHPLSLNIRRLEELGMVLRIGLTPTDILHADGSYLEFDSLPSKLGVEIQAGNLGIEVPLFINQVKEAVVNKISREVLKKLVHEETGTDKLDVVSEALFHNAIEKTGRRDFACRVELNKPIIGIGAPVGAYLPGVADRFHTRLVIPIHSEIGNAAGAISGNVMESVETLIKPKKGMGSMDEPPCTMYSMMEKKDFETLSEAIEYARSQASEIVKERALADGADEVEMIVDNERVEAKLDKGWGGDVLLELKLTVTAVGKPRLFFEAKR